jgi:hypothetical protein
MPRKTDLGDNLVKVPIAFPEEMYEWLRLEAFQRRVPMAELVRAAVLGYRERAQAGAEANSHPKGSRR